MKYFLIISFFVLMRLNVFSQDIHFSQFYNCPLYENPALTGNFNGNIRVVANYRNQWNTIAVPFRSTSFSFDSRLFSDRLKGDAIGLGVILLHDISGEGGLQYLQPMLSFSWNHAFGERKEKTLSAGLQTGFFKRSIDFSKLTFANQYVEGEFDQGLSSGENQTMYKATGFELASGVNYEIRKVNGNKADFGFSVFHLTRPNESMLGQTDRIHLRKELHGSGKIRLSNQVFLIPSLLYMNQDKANEFTPSTNVAYILSSQQNGEVVLNGGLSYRVKDAAIFYFGLGIQRWQVGFSYDVNVSSLHPASRYNGGFELSLIYIDNLIQGKNKLPVKVPCKRM